MIVHKKYFFGFDYLRAVFCIFVVAWHNFIFGRPTYSHEYTFSTFSPHLRDILYFNVLLLAVPLFFQLAVVLYIPNRQSGSGKYFTRRIIRLLSLFLFWSALSLLFRYFILGWNFKGYFSNLSAAIDTLISGGRSLFFFFFSLIVLTALTELLLFALRRNKCNNTFITVCFILSLAVLLVSPHFFAAAQLNFTHWTPTNFIPYVFSAFIIIDLMKNGHRPLTVSVLFILYLLFSVLEWTCIPYYIWSSYWGYIVPPYTRISVVFGAMLIVVLFGEVNKPPPKMISLVSQCSLGIYCLHSFIPTAPIWEMLNIHPHPVGVVNCIVQLGGALILTLICRKLPLLRRFV